jgi:hypothetical protein
VPDLRLKLKTDEFTAFCRDLRATLGDQTTMQRVVDNEVGRVLEKAMEETDYADRQKIRERVKNRNVFRVGGKKYLIRNYSTGQPWRVPDQVWPKIQDMRNRSLIRKLAAVAITKRSWVDLAEKLGQAIKAPAFVRAAKVSNSGVNGNTLVERTTQGNENRYGLRVTNKSPKLGVPGTEGIQAFFTGLAGRIGFYHENLARGVFGSARKTASKYRGIVFR